MSDNPYQSPDALPIKSPRRRNRCNYGVAWLVVLIAWGVILLGLRLGANLTIVDGQFQMEWTIRSGLEVTTHQVFIDVISGVLCLGISVGLSMGLACLAVAQIGRGKAE